MAVDNRTVQQLFFLFLLIWGPEFFFFFNSLKLQQQKTKAGIQSIDIPQQVFALIQFTDHHLIYYYCQKTLWCIQHFSLIQSRLSAKSDS